MENVENTPNTELNEEDLFDNFDVEDEEIDLATEKLKEMNKKLPSWDLEPPKVFLK